MGSNIVQPGSRFNHLGSFKQRGSKPKATHPAGAHGTWPPRTAAALHSRHGARLNPRYRMNPGENEFTRCRAGSSSAPLLTLETRTPARPLGRTFLRLLPHLGRRWRLNRKLSAIFSLLLFAASLFSSDIFSHWTDSGKFREKETNKNASSKNSLLRDGA